MKYKNTASNFIFQRTLKAIICINDLENRGGLYLKLEDSWRRKRIYGHLKRKKKKIQSSRTGAASQRKEESCSGEIYNEEKAVSAK